MPKKKNMRRPGIELYQIVNSLNFLGINSLLTYPGAHRGWIQKKSYGNDGFYH